MRAFTRRLIAVDLDEPPVGYAENGQYFPSDALRAAPLDIIINAGGGYYVRFRLQRWPQVGQRLPLDAMTNMICSGVYEITHVETPPKYGADVFCCAVKLKEVRALSKEDMPIPVYTYG